jgi:hypothetical protein
MISDSPFHRKTIKEYIEDSYKLSDSQSRDALKLYEDTKIIDFETTDDGKLYFNGNYFRRENVKKADKILASLDSSDTAKIVQLQEILKKQVCYPRKLAISMLGEKLFEKLHAIGMFDVTQISNEKESVIYISRPAAFYKFKDPLVDLSMTIRNGHGDN